MSKRSFDYILNNTLDLVSDEIENLNKILFDYEVKKPEANSCQFNEAIANDINANKEPIINSFSMQDDDFFDIFENLLPDQLLPDQYYESNYSIIPQEQPNTKSISDSFINSITETNNLIYNNDLIDCTPQQDVTPVAPKQSNSSIEIIKLSDIKQKKNDDMPLFEDLIMLNESRSCIKELPDHSTKVVENAAFNDENEEDLLPWERQKRMSMKRTCLISI